MELDDAIRLRRSYRSYSSKNISEGDLNKILDAGNKAPVALGNYLNTKILVLENEKLDILRNKLISILGKDPTYNSNKLILIYSKNTNNDLACLDAGCISENIMLKARDLSIDSVMIYSIKSLFNNNELLKEYNNLSNEYKFIVSIALGYRSNDVVRDVTHKIEVIK